LKLSKNEPLQRHIMLVHGDSRKVVKKTWLSSEKVKKTWLI